MEKVTSQVLKGKQGERLRAQEGAAVMDEMNRDTLGPLQEVCFSFISYFFIPLLLFVELLSHVQLCDSMDCSTPGFPALHYLLKFAQIHVH